MKIHRFALVATAAALLVGFFAADAFAQRIPNVPGNGAIRRAIQDQINSQVPNAAGAAGNQGGLADAFARAAAAQPTVPPLPDAAAQPSANPAAAQDPSDGSDDNAAPASSRGRGSDLPATGIPALAFGLFGIALLSGGRMLHELAKPRLVAARA